MPRPLCGPMYSRRDLDISGFRDVKNFMTFCDVELLPIKSILQRTFRFHGSCTEVNFGTPQGHHGDGISELAKLYV